MTRRRQFGSIERLRSGRWRARYKVDGEVFQAPRTFATKGDAGAFLDAIRVRLDRGEWRDPRLAKIRFEEWADEFMATKRDRRPKTIVGYESLLRARLLPRFGAMELADRLDAAWRIARGEETSAVVPRLFHDDGRSRRRRSSPGA